MASRKFRLLRVTGIDIYVHWTFGLLIVGLPALYVASGTTIGQALYGLGLIMAVFGCVVLHELGHALAARRYDVPTRDITLYPIGGVARLQRIPEEPMQEFVIAIAGPLVNLGIAAGIFGVVASVGSMPTMRALMEPTGYFFPKLMGFNLILFGFNLIPAFPMDGGRVLRAVLASQMDYVRATQIAAGVGQGVAILFGFLGFVSFNPILLFIALFVYLGAQQEASATSMRVMIEGVPVQEAMMTRFESLTPRNTLQDAVDKLLQGSDESFPVLEDERLVGVLTRKRLTETLSGAEGAGALVGDVMLKSFPVVGPTDMLDEAFRQMQEQGSSVAPVVRNGRLVGLLTLENVGELMMVFAALRDRSSSRRNTSRRRTT